MIMVVATPPFWQQDRSLTFPYAEGRHIKYDATLVPTTARREASSFALPLPMIVFFGGMNSPGGLRADVLKWLGTAEIQNLGTFVFVAPFRPEGHWWFLDKEHYFGWVDGAFKAELVDAFLCWLCCLSDDVTIDRTRVSLLGFSAGAYAVVELLARNDSVSIQGAIIGGVHGHAQPDLLGVEGLRSEAVLLVKWHAFVSRLEACRWLPSFVFVVHNKQDKMCPWTHAEVIHKLLVDSPSSGRVTLELLDGPFGHSYFHQTFTSRRLQRLLSCNKTLPCSSVETECLRGDVHVRKLKCHTPGCRFRVHPDIQFGGFCCRQCHMVFDSERRDLLGSQHGPKCYGTLSVATDSVADNIPPLKPMALQDFKGKLQGHREIE